MSEYDKCPECGSAVKWLPACSALPHADCHPSCGDADEWSCTSPACGWVYLDRVGLRTEARPGWLTVFDSMEEKLQEFHIP